MSERRLTERIQDSLTKAIKDCEPVKIRTLRLMIAALKDKEINLRTEKSLIEVKDADVIKMLRSMIKQREESIKYFIEGGRNDLADQEKLEIDVINEFLPKQMNEEQTSRAVSEVIKKNNANSLRDISKIVGQLQSKFGDTINMTIAMKFVMEILRNGEKE